MIINGNLFLNEIVILKEQIETEVIFEAVNKALKEMYEREEARKQLKPITKLHSFLKERWKSRIKSKEELLERKNEQKRFKEVLRLTLQQITEVNPEIKSKIKEITNDNVAWDTDSTNGDNCFYFDGHSYPRVLINFKGINNFLNGFNFKNPNNKIVKKFLVYHEYGHLYEFLKSYVLTGNGKIVDTRNDSTEKVSDSEGKANSFAIDGMYRKDRRELLKNTSENIEDFEKSKKEMENLKNKKEIKISDVYRSGTLKNSEKLEKTLRSIEKERNNLKEENKIFNY